MAEFVKVIVRCRPLNEREVENDVDVVITVDSTEQQIVLRHSCEFMFTAYWFCDLLKTVDTGGRGVQLLSTCWRRLSYLFIFFEGSKKA